MYVPVPGSPRCLSLTLRAAAWFCFKHNLWTRLTALKGSTRQTLLTRLVGILPQSVINLLVSKLSFWLGGILLGLSLFIEDTQRRGELAMYVLPKALESAWMVLRGKGIVFQTGRYGDALVGRSLCVPSARFLTRSSSLPRWVWAWSW